MPPGAASSAAANKRSPGPDINELAPAGLLQGQTYMSSFPPGSGLCAQVLSAFFAESCQHAPGRSIECSSKQRPKLRSPGPDTSSPPPGSGLCTQVLSARPRAQRRVQQQTTAEVEVSRARHKSVVLWQHAADVIEPMNPPIPITRDLQPDEKHKNRPKSFKTNPLIIPLPANLPNNKNTDLQRPNKNADLQKKEIREINPIQP